MSLPVRVNQEPDLRSPASSTETFTDTNVNGLLHLATDGSSSARPGPPLASWAGELSASFAIIAEQLQNASRTISTHAPPISSVAGGPADHLVARLDAIELAQERLAVELAALRSLHAGKSRAPAPNEQFLPDAASSASSGTSTASSLADLERRLADALVVQKLEQDRLYARLHNSRATVSKMSIMALPTASGKPPPNHPNTKGEFEHLTKERYEALLKAYDQPIQGDTAAKREALRVFLGLPAA
ncbi:hypothetical protein EDB92DRAFT_1948085 [Lactarius akahatsu]|uniref:Uncharacterized protein n=1 Tax=Lactarius akahatsu TaxID=416441 RepID=A0AAD4LC83_9AGAM|nr:hypothetical protein EDB92DRAFT_1948085 [Lactarius akahatsu]